MFSTTNFETENLEKLHYNLKNYSEY